MLKLHFKDNRQPASLVTQNTYTLGSANDNHLIIEDIGVDAHHAKIFTEDDRLILKDNNSKTGCFINGQRVTQKEILPGDILKFGQAELIVIDPQRIQEQDEQFAGSPWRLVSDSSWLPGKTFLIVPGKPVVIGRTDKCDITIPGTHLSRRHVELMLQGDRMMVKDLGSANGTFLNEKPVSEIQAHHGDRLRLDVYSFRFVAPQADGNKTRIRPAPAEAFAKPVERKQLSNEPKRWKTKPTSPGNRMEPTYDETHTSPLVAWIIASFIVVGVGLLAVKFLH